MSNTKHTPGPWCIVGGEREQLTVVCKPGDGIVTHVARLHDAWICDEHGGTAFDNARLIAAAPDLLASLRACRELLDNSDVRHYIGTALGEMAPLHAALNASAKAIAKATQP